MDKTQLRYSAIKDSLYCEIIDNTPEARKEFGLRSGAYLIVLTLPQMLALSEGKTVAVADDEYSIFITRES